MVGVDAVVEVEAAGVGDLRPPHAAPAADVDEPAGLQRPSRVALVESVGAAEVVSVADPPQQQQLVFLQRIPSLHPLDIRLLGPDPQGTTPCLSSMKSHRPHEVCAAVLQSRSG